jgi:hypothetical protein
MKNPIIIGLCGLARSGKSTFCAAVSDCCDKVDITCEIISFASAVKDIAKSAFGWDGKKDERGRRLLQLIGTDCGRAYNENIWVDVWRKRVLASPAQVILVDDVRFENESAVIHAAGGRMLKIRTHGQTSTDLHASEKGIDSHDVVLSYDLGDLDRIAKDAERVAYEALHERGMLPVTIPILHESGGVKEMQLVPDPHSNTAAVWFRIESKPRGGLIGYEGDVCVDGQTVADTLAKMGIRGNSLDA